MNEILTEGYEIGWDVYKRESVERLENDDVLNPEDAGFLYGYLAA